MTEIDISELIVEELKELKLRVARLEREDKTTAEQQTTADNELIVGDRVTIKNQTHKPKTWPPEKDWSDKKERTETVTKVTPHQVHFTTDNGTRTWQAPHNLSKIH
jgi:hypothetical protein